MAYLKWREDRTEGLVWHVVRLAEEGTTCYLTGRSRQPIVFHRAGEPTANEPAYLLSHPRPGGLESWVLLTHTDAGLLVNGKSASAYCRLEHDDRIHLGQSEIVYCQKQTAGSRLREGLDG